MLLSQWKSAQKKSYLVEELQEILAIPDTYSYNKFKIRILNKAQVELLEKADICFEYEELKKGRGKKITDIEFRIYPNTKNNRDQAKDIQEDLAKYDDLTKQYKGKILYFNGRDHTIQHVSKNKNTHECDVLLIDEYNEAKRYLMPEKQLELAKDKVQ